MSITITRRFTLAAMLTCLALPALAQEMEDKVRIGYAISKTGIFAGGAAASAIPIYEMWVKEINKSGGLKVGDKRLPIEVVEYDDRSSPEEAVRAVERLISQDKVDLILAPWGTGLNLAVAPILSKAGYPHLAFNTLTERADNLVARWPGIFFFEGTSAIIAKSGADMLAGLREEGKIGNKVALVGIADALGVELSANYRKVLIEHGFEIVYDASYPLATQDFTPMLSEIASKTPDVFIANTYPEDSITITDQARIMSFNPAVYLLGVGPALPVFGEKFGANTEGVMALGGANIDNPEIQDFFKRHVDSAGYPADRFASQLVYAGLQALQQAIETSATLDHETIITELKSGNFKTVLGEISLKSQELEKFFHIGQWQNGDFYGLYPSTLEGARSAIVPKPAWK
ncbi:amino acid ABC transporter substrate-binding protein [Brucella pituitosa]|uniref:amino acid ABC transporter substrate-binding protein n=1 Tax=Brucella pituitosa TaxID=571256 RepID=UPI003F4AD690